MLYVKQINCQNKNWKYQIGCFPKRKTLPEQHFQRDVAMDQCWTWSEPGSRSNRILHFRIGSELYWILKKLNGIRYGYPNCIDHCNEMLNQSLFRTQTGLDQIFRQVYRIRIGPDHWKKILDWIRIPKIPDLFNTTMDPEYRSRLQQNSAFVVRTRIWSRSQKY